MRSLGAWTIAFRDVFVGFLFAALVGFVIWWAIGWIAKWRGARP